MASKRKPKLPPLTEQEWRQVFEIRCRSKRGERLWDEEEKLFLRALKEDPKRYSAMDDAIFAVTAPFGSAARRRLPKR